MIILWHNPRCSKSRQALALLEAEGIAVEVRRYLEDAPTSAEIDEMRTALGGLRAIDMMRSGEKLFKELGLGKTDPDARLVAAMAAHPILIERPIAQRDGRAVIGRPTDAVKALL